MYTHQSFLCQAEPLPQEVAILDMIVIHVKCYIGVILSIND